ncbi:tumor necrosis factor receptor type 1-associated DEATH domain protein-like [Branchiostoma floridae x Branchiostoma japonicum]
MDSIVTAEELDYVAKNISPRQSRRLLRKLGLKDPTIDQVFDDFVTEGSLEKIHQGLRKCKEIKGNAFTFDLLVKALRDIGMTELAENLIVEVLGLQPGENKGLVKVTVESELTRSKVTMSFIASEEDAKSIQSEIQKKLWKKKKDKRGSLKKILDKILK